MLAMFATKILIVLQIGKTYQHSVDVHTQKNREYVVFFKAIQNTQNM